MAMHWKPFVRKAAWSASLTPSGFLPALSPSGQTLLVVLQPISVIQMGLSSPLASMDFRTSR